LNSRTEKEPKPYVPPELTVHGNVDAVTRGVGGKGALETAGAKPPKTQ
jgi:hypothetical protein